MASDVMWCKKAIIFFSRKKNKIIRKGGLFLIMKIAPILAKLKKEVVLDFGGTNISVHPMHSSVYWSHAIPTMNWNLGRLAKSIEAYKPSSTIIDVGANVGDTYAIIRGSGVKADILAIEGDPTAIEWLTRNIAKDKNVVLWKGFVGKGDDADYVFSPQEGATSGVIKKNDVGQNVHKINTLPLDNIAKITKTEKIGLIKVDTDGFDTLVIRSAERIIREDHPVLFLEIQPYHLMRNDDVDSFFDWISSFGYNEIICWDNNGRFLCETNLNQRKTLKHLMAYFHGAPFVPFLDMAFFYYDDVKIKEKVIYDEINFSCMEFDTLELEADVSLRTLY